MTGQSLSAKIVLQWKKSFGNYPKLCLLQKITALPCGTCTVALQPRSPSRLHIVFRCYQFPLIARAVLHQRYPGQNKPHNFPSIVNQNSGSKCPSVSVIWDTFGFLLRNAECPCITACPAGPLGVQKLWKAKLFQIWPVEKEKLKARFLKIKVLKIFLSLTFKPCIDFQIHM